MGFALYLASLAALVALLPESFLDPRSRRFILLIGALTVWRYSWAGLHFVRSLVYRYRVFPRWREAADRLSGDRRPDHVYLLLTSFHIDSESSADVYRAAMREAIDCGAPATLVASIVELADERLIKQVFHRMDPPERVRLCLVRIPGTGKRDALACGFSAISRLRPPENAVVAVVDGDTVLAPGSISRCTPLFALRPQMAALTTDEECRLEGEDRATNIYRLWYSVRFAMRHVLMSSMGLSRRVLTLTGRFSMFRCSVVTDPEFIRLIERDHVDHWRLGRFQFLTGDDKSSWFFLLRAGWEMLYVPDVQVLTIERPPAQSFAAGTTMLMMRWFGNMLRTNQRARGVPRARIGTFVWWTLIDQRISMWTSLFGITAAAWASAAHGLVVLHAYACWVGFTRLLQTAVLRSARPSLSAWYPFLLFFNQIYSSLVKIYMLHHLNRQKWTRQKTRLSDGRSALARLVQQRISDLSLATSALVYVVAVGFTVGGLEARDVSSALRDLRWLAGS